MLTLRGIGKIYTKEGNVNKALSGINLTFDKDEFVAITGKSGSGKSTLLGVISGLECYEEGEMYLDGKPTSQYTKEDWDDYNTELISFIFQDYNILESFTVLENVEYALLSIKDIKERRRKAKEIIARVGLTERMNAKGGTLSGGEKQRTVIARAVAKDSPIILADEPTGNLDTKTAKEVLELLKEVSKGKLLIIVTHNYEDVKEYATRHIRLFDGEVESDTRFDGKSDETAKTTHDKYDFSDAYEYVFKKRNAKGTARASAVDTILLGAKRFASRPKQASVITTLISVVMVTLFLIIGYLFSATVEFSPFQLADIDGRVLVVKNDGTAFTKDEAKALQDGVGASDYLFNDKYIDGGIATDGVRIESKLYSEDNYYRQRLGAMIGIDDGGKVSEGTNAVDGFQAVLNTTYSEDIDYNVGDTLFLTYDSKITFEVTLVGIKRHLNTKDAVNTIEFSRATYDKIALLLRNRDAVSIVYRETKDDGNTFEDMTYEGQLAKICFTDRLKGKSAEIVSRQFSIFENLDRIYYRDALGELIKLDTRKSATSEYDEYMTLSADIMGDFAKDNTSRQISLIFSDKGKMHDFMKGNNGYQKIEASKYKAVASDSELGNVLFKVIYLVIIAFVAVAITMVLVVSVQKLLYATKGDIAIFRTMGINQKIVKRSTYVQLFLSLIPAYILVAIVAMVLYFAPLGISSSFYVMGVDGALTLIAGSILVVALVAMKYNRILYSEKIRKGLRRVNK